MKNHFRVHYEILNNHSTHEASLRMLARQEQNIQRGRYHSIGFYPYDGDYPDEDALGRTYHSGRVAWENDDSVFVTTLVIGITKKYMNQDNLPVRYFFLGHDLLVV